MAQLLRGHTALAEDPGWVVGTYIRQLPPPVTPVQGLLWPQVHLYSHAQTPEWSNF